METKLWGLFSLFALGFAGALLVVVTEPRVAEVFAYVALAHGLLAVVVFALALHEGAK